MAQKLTSGAKTGLTGFSNNYTPIWFMEGGIPAGNVLGAWCPKRAASYADSKRSLINPSASNLLVDGVAFPTWAAATGWTFVDGSLQYLTIASALVTTIPLSIVVRFNADTTANLYGPISICDTAAASFFTMLLNLGGAGAVSAYLKLIAAEDGSSSTAGHVAGNWYTAAAVYSANNARASYLNGANKGTNAANITPAGLDTTYIGAVFTGAALQFYYDGKIAACAIYNIALSDAQVLALHNAMALL